MEGREAPGGASEAASASAGWYADPERPGQLRYWDGQHWTEQRKDAPAQTTTTQPKAAEEREASPIALALVGLGVVLAIIGTFLPVAEAKSFVTVADNSLIQGGDGWIVIGAGVGAAAAAYAAYARRRRSWAVLVLGLVIVAVAVYDGTGDRLELSSLSPGARSTFGLPQTEKASPGTGIYMAGAGGAIVAFGGLGLAGFGAASRTGNRKKCPDCGEMVQADARICRYCRHEFEAA